MDREDLERASQRLGLSFPPDLDFVVTGAEPILASPHHLALAAGTARALVASQADALWRLRGGPAQKISVDATHAALGLLSFLFVRFLDGEPAQPDDSRHSTERALTDIFKCGDGRYVQLHGSFRDGDAYCELLGIPAGSHGEEITRAVARWDSHQLETEIIARGLCGSLIRTRDEWSEHLHGRVLADLPVVGIDSLGSAPPREIGAGPRPVSGIRVLDLTHVLAGPTCARALAEHGADVLHITTPRSLPLLRFDVDTGVGKRQAVLDLDEDRDLERLRDLVAHCDVVVQGLRPGVLERRGLGAADLAREFPGIVYVTENCFGPQGPWSTRPGWEQVAQGATGLSEREGRAHDGVPRLTPAAANDYTTGWLAAAGALEALVRQRQDGGSYRVDASLCQTSMWIQNLGDDLDPYAAPRPDSTGLLTECDSPDYGRVSYLSPAPQMSVTPPALDLPPVRPGHHDAEWWSRN
jgi:crotonobetainyl-CoA:carnitine CoA-transferase CaiB-like acyl-CoA transferase